MKLYINKKLAQIRQKDYVAKLFYSVMRECAEKGEELLDIGADIENDENDQLYLNAFLDDTHNESIKNNDYSRYASSWGTKDLREGIVYFYEKWSGVSLDWKKEVMVSRGIMDAVNKVFSCLDVTHIIIPDIAPYYVSTAALIKDKEILNTSVDLTTGELDLKSIEAFLLKNPNCRPLMYITHPCAPAGCIMSDKYIQHTLIPWLLKNNVFLIADSYIFGTRFDGGKIKSILSYKDAMRVCVEAITISKEFGLPGVRAGGIAGCAEIIEAVRLYAACTIDIVATSSMRIAAKALREIDTTSVSDRVRYELKNEIEPKLSELNWPYIRPVAGFDMLLTVPRSFFGHGIVPSLLLSLFIMKKWGVCILPYSIKSFNGDESFYLRVVLKQQAGKIGNALGLLLDQGFDWNTVAPDNYDVDDVQALLKNLPDLTKL